MSGAKTIDDITGIAACYHAAIESYPVTVCSNIENVTVDTAAASWLPDDAPPFLPVRIYRDGNCLPRCGSLMAYEVQDHNDKNENADTDCIGSDCIHSQPYSASKFC